MGSDSDETTVFVFRMWRRDSFEWEQQPPLRVYLSADAGAEPEQLSWVAHDGTECSVGFAADLSTCYGHRRSPSLRTMDIRGELDRRETVRESEFRGYEFDTETLDKGRHPKGRLRLPVDAGDAAPPRWVAWRDRSATAYSIALWSPAWSDESGDLVVAGLRIKLASLTFHGYRQPAGQEPIAYRGVWANAGSDDVRELTPAEPEPVALQPVPAGTPCLPSLLSVPLVRTDFTDDDAWTATSTSVTAQRHLQGGDVFCADVEPVDDTAFEALTATQLCQLVPPGVDWSLLLIADRTTMTSAEHHVLVVDLDEDNLGRTFRATPPAIQEIENNLSLANMDWEDFAPDDDSIVGPMLL
ncbi:DUF6924 domain-containing protein [Nocardia callitridis]|uniref:DUF6924 domain-containing protein n=1 Tax=Nocardia callitridis TaxID=648753 RepID=UPI0031EAEAA6